MKAEPVVAKWELWTVATMLVSTHGDDAEAHAQAKLADALECEDETNEIVWRGILTQLAAIRAERARIKSPWVGRDVTSP